ncbi:uncharacterized protein PpBr36_10800 [Pyricularia pennisetigena]|uniref:uncharacterized protein n=1 Tax=Pyricularia pennisetigena TaxID=1578925 RepID=UPI00114F8DFA|nr:uncharacterized protein PpBr36_10800 [Pyricularia pennisetigena]TLS21018.1 hypothetical protein PpBr36_10800 [Pyricularia pennisetigena]
MIAFTITQSDGSSRTVVGYKYMPPRKGYSDPDQLFIVRNSWGEGWVAAGFCYMLDTVDVFRGVFAPEVLASITGRLQDVIAVDDEVSGENQRFVDTVIDRWQAGPAAEDGQVDDDGDDQGLYNEQQQQQHMLMSRMLTVSRVAEVIVFVQITKLY